MIMSMVWFTDTLSPCNCQCLKKTNSPVFDYTNILSLKNLGTFFNDNTYGLLCSWKGVFWVALIVIWPARKNLMECKDSILWMVLTCCQSDQGCQQKPQQSERSDECHPTSQAKTFVLHQKPSTFLGDKNEPAVRRSPPSYSTTKLSEAASHLESWKVDTTSLHPWLVVILASKI